MLPKDQNKLFGAIYSLDHYKEWQKIARASKQCEASDVAQEAFLFVIEKWVGEFDLSSLEHWNELEHKNGITLFMVLIGYLNMLQVLIKVLEMIQMKQLIQSASRNIIASIH